MTISCSGAANLPRCHGYLSHCAAGRRSPAAHRIPQPSSLYGSSTTSVLLNKLQPPRVSPLRGGSCKGSYQATVVQLAPYTQFATTSALDAGTCWREPVEVALCEGCAQHGLQRSPIRSGFLTSSPPCSVSPCAPGAVSPCLSGTVSPCAPGAVSRPPHSCVITLYPSSMTGLAGLSR